MLKAEFKEEKKEVSHVGLYRSKIDGLIVLFLDGKNKKAGVAVTPSSDGMLDLGAIVNNFCPCDASSWEKIDANSVTFTW